MPNKWRRFCLEGGIRQSEKNLLRFWRLPEFKYELRKDNFTYAHVHIFSSINRRKTQVI